MKALRTLKLATAAIALVAVALPARAGLLNFTKTEMLITAAAGVGMVAINTYKDRCKSGGGWFDDLGTFQQNGTTVGRGLPLNCPANVNDWSTAKYASAVVETHNDVASYKVTTKLRKNMKAAGKGERPDGCEAHHIVPEKGGGSKTPEPSDADLARDILASCGVDINDAANGVYLPGHEDPSKSNCSGAYHKKVHTPAYFQRVYAVLKEGFRRKQCAGIRPALDELSDELANSGRVYSPNSVVSEPAMPNFN